MNHRDLRDIYFTEEYGKIYENNRDGKLETYIHESDKGKVIYRFLKREINLMPDRDLFDIITPYGYGGPLIIDYDESNIEELILEFKNGFEEYCRENNIVSEFIRFHPLIENYRNMEIYSDIENIRSTICINLDSKENIWKNLSPKCKNHIRKAYKNNIKISIGTSEEELEEFINLYSKTMKQKNAKEYYFFDKDFFTNTMKLLEGNIRIFKATYDGKNILSALIMNYGNYVHYHLSGGEPEYLNLGVNNLLIYEVALWGLEKGYDYFHLGGGYLGDSDNLFAFKKSFSIDKKNEKKFYIGRKINMEKEYEELVKIYEHKKNIELGNSVFFPKYRSE